MRPTVVRASTRGDDLGAGWYPFGTGVRLLGLAVILLGLFIVSFALGRYPVTPGLLLRIFASQALPIDKTWTATVETVVFQVRLPRIVAAMVIGMALSASGAGYQALFKNPLASPSLLGVSAGAGFGAALGILTNAPWLAVQALAFGGGLFAVGLAWLIGRLFGGGATIVLILGGLVISALFQALIAVLQFLANPVDTLPAITFWLMGGLGRVTNRDVAFAIVPILLCCGVLYALRWQINVLGVGRDEAATLGVNTARVWLVVIGTATLMTALTVSIGGIIGWVGLVIPHLARMVVGPNFQRLLPAAILMGGAYLLLVDDLCRSVGTRELPLGILTALLGAPFFIALLARTRTAWS